MLGLIRYGFGFVSSKSTLAELSIFFYSQKKELVDLASISDQEIKNDDIVYMVFAKEVGGGWEELQVDSFSTFGAEDASH